MSQLLARLVEDTCRNVAQLRRDKEAMCVDVQGSPACAQLQHASGDDQDEAGSARRSPQQEEQQQQASQGHKDSERHAQGREHKGAAAPLEMIG